MTRIFEPRLDRIQSFKRISAEEWDALWIKQGRAPFDF